MTIEITIGTEKQIAWAQGLIAKRAHPKMGGNLYILDAGLARIAAIRADIVASGASAEMIARAEAALDLLPTCAVFWIGSADLHVLIGAVVTGEKSGIIGQDLVSLYKALTA